MALLPTTGSPPTLASNTTTTATATATATKWRLPAWQSLVAAVWGRGRLRAALGVGVALLCSVCLLVAAALAATKAGQVPPSQPGHQHLARQPRGLQVGPTVASQLDSGRAATLGELSIPMGPEMSQPTTTEPEHQRRQLMERNEQLERRLDRLELELRRLLHNSRATPPGAVNPHLGAAGEPAWSPSQAGGSTTGSRPTEFADSQVQQQQRDRWNWSSRLELVEKFIAITSSKMYDTEARVSQLEQCDCRKSCKWPRRDNQSATSAAAATLQHAQLPERQQHHHRNNASQRQDNDGPTVLKMDGEVWRENKCDICSCSRGHVRCRHITCPEPQCAEPQHVAGKCCPVCLKSCEYKGERVKHGNKLVINSAFRDTCKQCTCYDGALRCQRVDRTPPASRKWDQPAPHTLLEAGEQPRRQRSLSGRSGSQWEPRAGGSHVTRRWQDEHERPPQRWQGDDDNNPSDHSAGERANNGETVEEEEDLDEQPPIEAARRRRFVQQLGQPMVCPQVECAPEEQVQFRDDCCTYCRGHDFCSKLPGACHPEAECSLADWWLTNSSSFAGAGPPPEVWDSPQRAYRCTCRRGFEGDGRRQCRDVDECAGRSLNNCDPDSSRCVNTRGGFRCECNPGFRPASQQQQQQQPVAEGERRRLMMMMTSADSTELVDGNQPSLVDASWLVARTRVGPVCVDLDECSSSGLNRCHQDAECVNKRGSYECKCKLGHLGNGFECHRWHSTGPQVAAYIHRHAHSTSGHTRLEPLSSVGESSEGDLMPAGSGAGQVEWPAPEASEFRWQPVRFAKDSSEGEEEDDEGEEEGDENNETGKHQMDSSNGTSQSKTQQTDNDDNIDTPTAISAYPAEQQQQHSQQLPAEAPNTRTMLIQRPSKFWVLQNAAPPADSTAPQSDEAATQGPLPPDVTRQDQSPPSPDNRDNERHQEGGVAGQSQAANDKAEPKTNAPDSAHYQQPQHHQTTLAGYSISATPTANDPPAVRGVAGSDRGAQSIASSSSSSSSTDPLEEEEQSLNSEHKRGAIIASAFTTSARSRYTSSLTASSPGLRSKPPNSASSSRLGGGCCWPTFLPFALMVGAIFLHSKLIIIGQPDRCA